jgi:hypothetical protein
MEIIMTTTKKTATFYHMTDDNVFALCGNHANKLVKKIQKEMTAKEIKSFHSERFEPVPKRPTCVKCESDRKKAPSKSRTKTIYRCGDCGVKVSRDGACSLHPNASSDPEVHNCMENLTTMGDQLVCRVCTMKPLIDEVLAGKKCKSCGNSLEWHKTGGPCDAPDFPEMELFVFGRWFGRGDEGTVKFRVFKSDVEEAFRLAADEADENETQEFMDKMESKYHSTGAFGGALLLNAIVVPNGDPAEFNPRGFGVWHEEAAYGVGPTKEAARIAFTKIEIEGAGSDDNW